MPRRLIRPVLLVLAAGALAVPASATATDGLFMQIDGAVGDSGGDDQYPNASKLTDFTWTAKNASQPGGTGGGGGSARVQWDAFKVSKKVDSASPFLVTHANNGAQIASIRIVDRRAGTNPVGFLQYCLEHVIVSTYTVSSADAGPEEGIGFNPANFEMRYVRQKADGSSLPSVLTGWNIVSNTSVGFNNACGGINTR